MIILEKSIDLFLLLFLQGLAKNLEQPEIKDWLNSTKDMLMGDKSAKDSEKAAEQLNGTLLRFDQMAVKVTETKAAVDCLWKCYQVSFGFF